MAAKKKAVAQPAKKKARRRMVAVVKPLSIRDRIGKLAIALAEAGIELAEINKTVG